MSKDYVKDVNGKYRFVDKDKQEEQLQESRPPTRQQQEPETPGSLTLEEVDAMVKRLELIVIGVGVEPRK